MHGLFECISTIKGKFHCEWNGGLAHQMEEIAGVLNSALISHSVQFSKSFLFFPASMSCCIWDSCWNSKSPAITRSLNILPGCIRYGNNFIMVSSANSEHPIGAGKNFQLHQSDAKISMWSNISWFITFFRYDIGPVWLIWYWLFWWHSHGDSEWCWAGTQCNSRVVSFWGLAVHNYFMTWFIRLRQFI